MSTEDREGFADFAPAQTPSLLGFAHALTANPHDAWDLTQETLARMGERWGRTRFEEPAAYARTVMVRLNIDRIRRLRRELPLLHRAARAAPVAVVGESDAWLVEALGPSRRGSAPRWPCATSRTSTSAPSRSGWAAPRGRSRASCRAGPNGSASTRASTARCAPRVERHEMNDDQQAETADPGRVRAARHRAPAATGRRRPRRARGRGPPPASSYDRRRGRRPRRGRRVGGAVAIGSGDDEHGDTVAVDQPAEPQGRSC